MYVHIYKHDSPFLFPVSAELKYTVSECYNLIQDQNAVVLFKGKYICQKLAHIMK